jgi:hypothetical protein
MKIYTLILFTTTVHWSSFRLGNYAISNGFENGDFELVEIYSKALTAEEVTNLYNDARYVKPNLEHGGVKSLFFNPSSAQYAYLADNGSLDINQANTDFCLTGFLKTSSDITTTQYLFGKNVAASLDGRYGFYISGGVLNAAFTSSGSSIVIADNITLATNTEYHLVLGVDLTGKRVYFYIDGVLQNAGGIPFTGTIADLANKYEFYIGAGNNADGSLYQYPLRGEVRDVRIYHSDITGISNLANLQAGSLLGGEVARWKCDDESLTTVVDSVGSYNLIANNFTSLSFRNTATSKILHVHAFDGVPRNVLSGDTAGKGERLTNNYDWLGTNGTTTTPTDWFENREPLFSTSGGILTMSQGALGTFWGLRYNLAAVIGTLYRVRFRWKSTLNSVIRTGDTGNWIYFTATGDWQDSSVDYVATSTTFFFTEGGAGNEDILIDHITLEEIIPEVTNTDVEVVKEGQVRVPRFNGATSKIDCGDYNDLTGDITVLAWVRPFSSGESGLSRILGNGSFFIRFNYPGTDHVIQVRSDGSTSATTDLGAWKEHLSVFVVILRKANGDTTCYINGVIDAGMINESSGTPTIGFENIIVGNNENAAYTLDGDIPEVQVLSGLLTPEEISQYYSSTKHSTKHLYNK